MTKVILRGFDIFDLAKFITITGKKYQAIQLDQIEHLVNDKELYTKIRKIILDANNDLIRDIIKNTFGDINF